MLERVSKLMVVLALVASVGLHWALLQGFAWTGMLITYTQQGTFREALEKTFDGKHPCSLCLKIGASKKAGKKVDFKIDGKGLDLIGGPGHFAPIPPTSFSLLRASDEFSSESSVAPPSPPPRFV